MGISLVFGGVDFEDGELGVDAAEDDGGQFVSGLGGLEGEELVELLAFVVEVVELEILVDAAAVEDIFDLLEADLLHLLYPLLFYQLYLILAPRLPLVRLQRRLCVELGYILLALVHSIEIYQLLQVLVAHIFYFLPIELYLGLLLVRLLALD